MDGRWWLKEGSLAGLMTMIFENMDTETVPRWRQMFHQGMRRIRQRNHARAARRNVHHHYDVGNEIYELFLDEDWQYSCGYFPNSDSTLEEAQLAKKRHIAAKMLLKPGQRVLDIGCGWGGMGLYLAKNTGADVTGITLSDEQLARARKRAEGIHNVEFRLQDYRDVNERFDRIVSVGMFEHVGVGYFRQYFEASKRLMTDDGVMLLHSIGRFGPPGYTAPFIDKHIFPGGYIPSLSEVLPIIESVGLYVTDIEILRLHYADTLKAWGERFAANREKVVALRDERFYRMWEFYLAASEASFRSGDMMVFQIQLAKTAGRGPADAGVHLRDRARTRRPRKPRDAGPLAGRAAQVTPPAPFDPDALGDLYARARAFEDAGDRDNAAALFRECLAIDPDDHCGVAMRLAAFGLATPQRAPAAYVATLFGQHAETFDETLVDRLGYDVPRLARAMVDPHGTGPFRMLDLGCGTGLAGLAFADIAPDITGVDLAEEMLGLADEREVYGDLYVADAVDFMAEWDEAPFDLIVATDVWPYLGDLAPFCAAAAGANAITPGGLLIASSERCESGWRVTETQRFAHGRDYIEATLTAAGFGLLGVAPITVRYEEGVPVEGDLVIARLGGARG